MHRKIIPNRDELEVQILDAAALVPGANEVRISSALYRKHSEAIRRAASKAGLRIGIHQGDATPLDPTRLGRGKLHRRGPDRP